MFPAADGFITLAAQQDAFFAILVKEIGAEWIGRDPRFSTRLDRMKNRQALIDVLGHETIKFTKAELTERLGGKIPFGPVMDIEEVERDEHLIDRAMIVEVDEPGKVPIRLAGGPVQMSLPHGAVNSLPPPTG